MSIDATVERQLAQARQEQEELLAQIRRDVGAIPAESPERQQKVRVLAEIEKRINDEGAYPRRRYVSGMNLEPVYVDYWNGLQRRIEERGTRDFPKIDGHSMYGTVVMNLTIDATGRLVDAEVVRGSGNGLLDRKALAIVRASEPFGPFSAAMRAKSDQIVVTRKFNFSRSEAAPASGAASDSVAPQR